MLRISSYSEEECIDKPISGLDGDYDGRVGFETNFLIGEHKNQYLSISIAADK